MNTAAVNGDGVAHAETTAADLADALAVERAHVSYLLVQYSADGELREKILAAWDAQAVKLAMAHVELRALRAIHGKALQDALDDLGAAVRRDPPPAAGTHANHVHRRARVSVDGATEQCACGMVRSSGTHTAWEPNTHKHVPATLVQNYEGVTGQVCACGARRAWGGTDGWSAWDTTACGLQEAARPAHVHAVARVEHGIAYTAQFCTCGAARCAPRGTANFGPWDAP